MGAGELPLLAPPALMEDVLPDAPDPEPVKEPPDVVLLPDVLLVLPPPADEVLPEVPDVDVVPVVDDDPEPEPVDEPVFVDVVPDPPDVELPSELLPELPVELPPFVGELLPEDPGPDDVDVVPLEDDEPVVVPAGEVPVVPVFPELPPDVAPDPEPEVEELPLKDLPLVPPMDFEPEPELPEVVPPDVVVPPPGGAVLFVIKAGLIVVLDGLTTRVTGTVTLV